MTIIKSGIKYPPRGLFFKISMQRKILCLIVGIAIGFIGAIAGADQNNAYAQESQKKIFLFTHKNPRIVTIDISPKESLKLIRGNYLLVNYEDRQGITLETMLGDTTGHFSKKDMMKYGKIETVSWPKEWDVIRKRKSPIIILMMVALLVSTLVVFTIYNDPEHKEKSARKYIAIIYFAVISVFLFSSCYKALKIGALDIESHLDIRRFDHVFSFLGKYILLPYGVVAALFHEGSATFMIRTKYLFLRKTAKEGIMERVRKKAYEERKKAYEVQKTEIEVRQRDVEQRLSNLRGDLPEVIDTIPKDIVDYQGYIGEVEKRFQERQIAKTTKVARERLVEVRMLCEEGAKLQRARADLEMANYEFSTVDKEISLKDKERTLKGKVLDRDILEADADISRLKRMSDKKEEREDFGI